MNLLNHKKTIIATIGVIAIVAIGIIVFFALTKKQNLNTKNQPPKEQIKITNAKTVKLDQKAIDLKAQIIKNPVRQDRGDSYLVQSREFTMIYVSNADQFYIFINNKPEDDNKKLAEKWFADRGFTKEQLCGLGLHFVLAVPDITPEQKAAFKSTADGCPALN